MNRGSAVSARVPGAGAARFNEAPIHESGKCGKADAEAGYRQCASMRPRFMNRGSWTLGLLAGGTVLASMRPRFMNRGSNEKDDEDRDERLRLQ